MRYAMKLTAVSAFVLMLAIGTAFAVGMEKYDASGAPDTSNKVVENGTKNVYGALKQVSLVDKVPVVLDEISFFVKDLLEQFGLADGKGE